MKRDYYEVLGVARDADERAVKRAYRQLAMQYHPDRNQSAGAEGKFKEASEAYEVLSDAKKRKIYDRAGFDGLHGQGFSGGFSQAGVEEIFNNFGDIFGDLFGMGGGRRRGGKGAARGGDLKFELAIDFNEAAFGCKKTITLPRHVDCERCKGRGGEPGTQPTRCTACEGRGQVVHGQGMFLVSTPCADCGGRGTLNANPCRDCRGDGHVRKNQQLEVTVPAGFDEGLHLRYSGEGEAGVGGAAAGDLYIAVHIRPHPRLKRDGEDVVTEAKVSITEAMLGAEISVAGVEGDEKVDVPKGTQPNDVITLRKRGIPRLRGGGRGNLHVVCRVEVPRSLSAKQKILVEELAASMGVKPAKKRSLFS